jgi:hypothetical protein
MGCNFPEQAFINSCAAQPPITAFIGKTLPRDKYENNLINLSSNSISSLRSLAI